ncbi:MAG: transposase, partial [Lachnospiraceae bacterium]|nr:transposase [Lachnospiraceae bacterium]
MLNDATCFKAVYIVCGYTDLRAGMDRLAALVETQTGNRPYIPDTLYLFCGRRTDRIKGLVLPLVQPGTLPVCEELFFVRVWTCLAV